jgi:purine-cytosine permease-like protein
VTIPALALAIFGYKWIHQAQKVMTAIFAVVIVVALIQAATYGHGVLKANRGFHLSSGPILIAVIGLFSTARSSCPPRTGRPFGSPASASSSWSARSWPA